MGKNSSFSGRVSHSSAEQDVKANPTPPELLQQKEPELDPESEIL